MKKRGYAALCLLMAVLCLLTACAPVDGTVYCRTKLREDGVKNWVRLSDGELIFEEEIEYPVYNGRVLYEAEPEVGYSVMHALANWLPPEGAEEVTLTYEDMVEYTRCDIVQVLRDAGVSERCIPQEGDFVTEGYRLTENVRYNPSTDMEVDNTMELHAGTLWGGDMYVISYAPDESMPWMKQEFGMAINYEGEMTGLYFDPSVWFKDPNSRVGEIPVYINYDRLPAPALGGWETDEFSAFFDIAGYSCGIYACDFTQQEFIDVLLAVINYYGAYPSRAAK